MTDESPLPASIRRIGWTSLWTDVASEMVMPVLPSLVVALGGGAVALGLIEGVADAVANLVKPWAGAVADRTGRRTTWVRAGYLVAALARPLQALTGSAWQVGGLRAVDRVGKGLRSAPRDALLAASVDAEDAGRAWAYQRVMDNTGAVIGPLLAALALWAGVTPRTVVLASIVPGLIGVVSAWGLAEVDVPSGQKVDQTPMSPMLRRFLVAQLLVGLGTASDTLLLLRAHELGVPTPALPLVWAALNLAIVFGARSVADRLDDGDPSRVARLAWLARAFALLAVGWTGSAAGGFAAMAAVGVARGAAEPAERLVVHRLAPGGRRGLSFGWSQATGGLAAIPAGLVIGGAWDASSAGVAMSVAAFWLVAGALVAGRVVSAPAR